MNDLKEFSLAKGYTLKDVSEATGYTKSFISQLERGLKRPSLDSLRKIADFLDIPIITLMEGDTETTEAGEDCIVLQAEEHHRILLSDKSGVSYEMLTPNTGAQELKGYICRIAPGESSSGCQVRHRHVECAYVLEGKMTVWTGETRHQVAAGDSL